MDLQTMLNLPAHLLRRAHQLSSAIFASELSQEDLTAIQYATLVAAMNPALSDTSKISAMIGVDRATLGGVVDRLEQKGLLARSPSPHDRRTKILSLTEAGRELIARVEDPIRSVQRQLLERLSAAEKKQLIALLQKLLTAERIA